MSNPELYYYGTREPAPKPYHYKECGLNNVYLMNGFSVEETDGEEYVSIENVDGLWKAIGLMLVTKRKTFSPAEIRYLRHQIGMTKQNWADIYAWTIRPLRDGKRSSASCLDLQMWLSAFYSCFLTLRSRRAENCWTICWRT